MSLQRLTDRFIQGIKSPKTGRLEFSDALVPGLACAGNTVRLRQAALPYHGALPAGLA